VPPGGDPPVGRVGDAGELALLARIARRVGPSAGGAVVLGIGDDTAALAPTPGTLTLVTADALVEGVHFRRSTSSAADVGWKAMAINCSDIASMGGAPTAAIVSLMLPAALEVAWVDGLYAGLTAAAGAFGLAIVGGNLAEAPVVVVDVTVLGEVPPDRLRRRSGAAPGDLVAVTGTLGRAAAGLLALEAGTRGVAGDAPYAAPDGTAARAIESQRRPQPRLRAGRTLGALAGVHAMIDLSDGLALDVWRVCEASGVGVRIDAARLPIDEAVPVVAGRHGRDPLDVALAGGEDYELLFTVAPAAAAHVLARLKAEAAITATVVGEIVTAASGRVVRVAGQDRPLEARGWTHFHLEEER
jgi:thiamine-monophosphate kinase